MSNTLDTIAVKSSIYWDTPTRYEAFLTCRTGRGFYFGITPGDPGCFLVQILSPCCGKPFHPAIPRSIRTKSFCPSCYTASPYPEADLCFRGGLKATAAWFQPALEHVYDPLTAFALAVDLQLWTLQVFFAWQKGRSKSDWQNTHTYAKHIATAVKALEAFAGPILPVGLEETNG